MEAEEDPEFPQADRHAVMPAVTSRCRHLSYHPPVPGEFLQ